MKTTIRMAVTLMLAAGLTACTEPAPPTPPDPVTVQLKWVHQAQFAGFYVAQEKGYYAAENLDVRLLEGGKGVDLAGALISGRADFAVLTPEDILIQRSQGYPLTAIAAIYRRSAVVFVSPVGKGIVRPTDFVGKTVAAGSNSGANPDFEMQFRALANRFDLDLSTIRLLAYDPEYAGLLDGTVDVSAAYLTGGVIKLRQKGARLNLIWPGDYGIRFYSDTLATTEAIVEKHPDRVTRFSRATLKGWRDAVGDPTAAVKATLKHARIQDQALQTAMMEALLPLVHTGENDIGWMKAADWGQRHRIMIEQKILPAPLANLDRAYTTRFLESIYESAAK